MNCAPPAALASIGRHARAVADAWSAAGATGCCLHGDGEPLPLAGSCDGDAVVDAALSGQLRGWRLAVHGLSTDPARVALDAELLSALADRTTELSETTQALIDANDQLLAVFGLADSSASGRGVDPLQSLVDDVHRLTAAQGAVLVLADGTSVSAGHTDALAALAGSGPHERDRVVRPDGDGPDVAVRRLRGRSNGTLLVAARPGHRLTTHDLKLIDAVTYFVSGLISLEQLHRSAVEGAVIERDAATAAELARLVLPDAAPAVPGLDLAARCDPARLAAGDFYTWAETPDGLVFAVGDVSGKGLAAAMVMTMVTAAATRAALAAPAPDPHELFETLASELTAYLDEASVFVTMVIGVHRPDHDELLLANAGHSPVFLRCGGSTTSLPPSAPPVGVLRELVAETVAVPFSPGDAVVIGTDGLTEQRDPGGRQLGVDRLRDLVAADPLRSSSDLIDRLFDEVEHFAGGRERDDDRTALVIRRTAEDRA